MAPNLPWSALDRSSQDGPSCGGCGGKRTLNELGGTWRAAIADEELRRSFAEPDFDDGGWETIAVPGHWRSQTAFADSDGPLLYRTTFEHSAVDERTRAWITFQGLFYEGDVWLDGQYLGVTEGYFLPHTFEITERLDRTEHTLAVEVTCSRETDRSAKRNLTGVFQHWDCLDPEWNPGGIWRPVHLDTTGPVRIRDLRVLCRSASAEQAVVVLRANLLTIDRREVTVRSRIGRVDHELTKPLAAGENHVEWTVTIPNPNLWWPWALGGQSMYDVAVEAWCDGERSHRRDVRTGLRRVDFRKWTCSINGERLFLKGANHGPARMALAEATPEELAGDVRLAKNAGLDLLRVHAHVTRPEFYDAADEAGVLVWQDMPLQWGYARGVRKQATRQARAAVQVLGHHPSIAIWCGHNEPMAIEIEPGVLSSDKQLARLAGKAFAAQELPTWNKTILDRSIKRALEDADGTRPVVAHSGVIPHPPQFDGTDSHLYFGWYWGEERDFERFCRTVPRMARFVSEFGAQAVPRDADFMDAARWPDLDWEHLGARHCLQKRNFDRYVPPAGYDTFDAWASATQSYQARLIKHHIETLRRIKYAPAGGFVQFCLADAMPAVTWSVLDHQRRAKLGYAALAAACEPVIVVADRLAETAVPGDELEVDVHVVSDLRHPLNGCVITAVVAWPGGEQTWRWAGDVPADACVRVGTLHASVPPTEGRLTVHLTLDGPVHATNTYETVIAGGS